MNEKKQNRKLRFVAGGTGPVSRCFQETVFGGLPSVLQTCTEAYRDWSDKQLRQLSGTGDTCLLRQLPLKPESCRISWCLHNLWRKRISDLSLIAGVDVDLLACLRKCRSPLALPRQRNYCGKSRICPYCWFRLSVRPVLAWALEIGFGERPVAGELSAIEHESLVRDTSIDNVTRLGLMRLSRLSDLFMAKRIRGETNRARDTGMCGRITLSPARFGYWRLRVTGLILAPDRRQLCWRLANLPADFAPRVVPVARTEQAWAHAVGWMSRYPDAYLIGDVESVAKLFAGRYRHESPQLPSRVGCFRRPRL